METNEAVWRQLETSGDKRAKFEKQEFNRERVQELKKILIALPFLII
jgi:hypothetical protein